MSTPDKKNRTLEFENLFSIWERRVEKILQRTDHPKFPFGIEGIDKITHGIPKGKVTVIAGRTSEAKTAFSLQAAVNIADAGGTVIYITLEDDSEQIVERIFCNLRQIDNQDMIRGNVSKEILNDPVILETLKRIKLVPVQNYGHNFEEIQESIDSLNPKPDIVFLDYIQMIEQLPKESEYDSLSRFAQKCKRFAEENDVGLVIISQINRSGAKEGRPQAHHLQGCGRLEQVADLLLILYCPYNYKDSSYDYDKSGCGMETCPRDYVEVNVAKNKNGIKNWIVKTRFTGKFYKFESWFDQAKLEKDYRDGLKNERDWRAK